MANLNVEASLINSDAAVLTTARYGFMVDGLRLIPQANILTEVIANAQIYAVPKSANALVGVLNLRGTIVPLFDPLQFARPASDIRPSHHRAMVFDRDEARAALLLDSDPQLLALTEASLETPRPNALLTHFLLKAWAQADDVNKIWWEFDHHAAFAALAQAPR
jgi:chemotaxis signal transduction protein